MKLESAASRTPEKPKGPSIEGVSRQAPESATERMARLQSMEKVAGKMDDFTDELSVEVAMSKDMGKRPGGERGEDMFLADKETGLTAVYDGLGGEGKGADASGAAAMFTPSLYKVMSKKLERADMGEELRDIAKRQADMGHPSKAGAEAAKLSADWLKSDPAVQHEIVALTRTVEKLSEKVRESGGKTTVSLGKTVRLPDGRMFEVTVNVGDSAAMKLDAEGRVADRTAEDSALDETISGGFLTAEEAKDPDLRASDRVRENLLKKGLPADRVEGFVGQMLKAYGKKEGQAVTVADLRRGMGQALGSGKGVVPRVKVFELKPGEKMAYMTDGILDDVADASGEFDAKKASAALREGGAGALMNEAAKGKKKDEKTILIKERVYTMDTIEEEEPEEELGEGDIEVISQAK